MIPPMPLKVQEGRNVFGVTVRKSNSLLAAWHVYRLVWISRVAHNAQRKEMILCNNQSYYTWHCVIYYLSADIEVALNDSYRDCLKRYTTDTEW